MKDIDEEIQNIVLANFQSPDIELVELQIRHLRNNTVVDVVVDYPQGGISIDKCVEINRTISNQLEEQDVISGSFIVEVSSPGLDRPLKTEKDFKRNIGKNVRFYLSEKVVNKLEHTGKILKVNDQEVSIKTKDSDFNISLNKINKAIKIID